MSERFLPLNCFLLQSDPESMYHEVVYFVKTTPHKVYPHLFLCFCCRFERQSRGKDANSMLFSAANTCTHRGPMFQPRRRRPPIVDDLGHWELSLIQRWRAEGMVGSSPVFHLFCKVSSEYR